MDEIIIPDGEIWDIHYINAARVLKVGPGYGVLSMECRFVDVESITQYPPYGGNEILFDQLDESAPLPEVLTQFNKNLNISSNTKITFTWTFENLFPGDPCYTHTEITVLKTVSKNIEV